MAYDSDINSSEEKRRLRKEAERDTELALERERLQKKEREDQHNATLKLKLGQLEDALHHKERDLAALKLEDSHLTRVVAESKRTSSGASSGRTVPALERLIRDNKEATRKLSEELRELERELEGVRRKEREKTVEERGRAERGKSAATRKAEQDRRARVLTDEIASLSHQIQDLKRQLK